MTSTRAKVVVSDIYVQMCIGTVSYWFSISSDVGISIFFIFFLRLPAELMFFLNVLL